MKCQSLSLSRGCAVLKIWLIPFICDQIPWRVTKDELICSAPNMRGTKVRTTSRLNFLRLFFFFCNFYNCISSVGIIPLFRIILRSKYHWFHLFWIQSLLTLDLWQCLLFSRVWNRTYDHKRRMMSNFVNFQRTCKTAKSSKRCWILKTFDLLLIWLPQENTLLIFTWR